MKKYPLKTLLEHRKRSVDDKTAELGSAVRVRELAMAARELALRTQKAAEDAAAEVRAAEIERLANGELRAGDLARGQAWEIGARTQLQSLATHVASADTTVVTTETAETAARGTLAKAMADRDVVAKDEMRFEALQKSKALAAEEEQAEEAFAPRGGRV